MDNIAISFINVTKSFLLQEDRTFKEMLPNLFRGKNLLKKFTAFSDLSFEIPNGSSVGIIGKNGSGKSTILKLIAGVTAPSKGNVVVNGKVAPLIELGAGFHHELTGYENIFLNAAILGLHKKEILLKIDDIIAFSELKDFIHIPIKRYSSGMYMRLGFSIAVHIDASIILIDEALAVGDIEFQKKCFNKLDELKKSKEKTIILVSHDEKAVKKFCERVILLDHGKIVTDGLPEKAYKKYNQGLEHIIV